MQTSRAELGSVGNLLKDGAEAMSHPQGGSALRFHPGPATLPLNISQISPVLCISVLPHLDHHSSFLPHLLASCLFPTSPSELY